MLWFMIVLGCLIGILGLGILLNSKPFLNYPEDTPKFDFMPLTDDLPCPVHAFYQENAGGSIPIIRSAVITGRGILRFSNIPFRARLRFIHRVGYDYRHYIEMMLFGRPILKVNEHYRGGKGYMELPTGTIEDVPEINASANQAIWGEALWFPTAFVTDSRVKWEGIDDNTAKLIVPYEQNIDEPEQEFIVSFDPQTHLIHRMETMRYRDVGKSRIKWILEGFDWKRWHDLLIPQVCTVTWADQGYPWLTMNVEDIVYNVDVSDYIMRRGC
jgi:hypothetical protein